MKKEINVVVVTDTTLDIGKYKTIRSEGSYRVTGCPSGKGRWGKRLGIGK